MTCFFRNQYEALYKATKPYQYVGGEYLSYNKDFDSAKVRFAFVFPDKYEIGISNLGVRIIYDRVNSVPSYLADRAYAPEPDFKPEFLYGVESKRALKDFDGIGFSLQYELSYPTVLKMLEMGGIGVKNTERKEDEPIVFAGGPCAFNPLPLADFIDVFCIGDGEEMMVEVCEVLEKGKCEGKSRKEIIADLCKIEGCWGVNCPPSPLAGTTCEQRAEGEAVPVYCEQGKTEGRSEGYNLAPSPLVGEGRGEGLIKASHFYTKQSLEYSKVLRKNMTDAENILWYYLRNRQLANMKFRRQEAIGNYIADFVCYEKKLILELDGGGHLEEKQILHDKVRDEFLSKNGFKVLRIYNTDIFKNIEGVIEYILMNISDPSPQPSPARGEGEVESGSSSRQHVIHPSPQPSPARGEGVVESGSSSRQHVIHPSPQPSPARGEGVVFAPSIQTEFARGERGMFQVKKRLSPLLKEYAPKAYPIPFSNSVQDRAVVEIRRGCGRMCRFCQPGHVTLPIRERSAEDIIEITKALVKNTGYDEYSMLSLSSNDYSNIREVIKELSVDFDERKISVSLPSQRIDGFNLELAELTQSVRKSTITLAPEAGSQRLRNVIKKNISEEQIINAALTLYENGWSKLKFYFICGLPTETLQDMDELAELLEKIRYKSRFIKKEKGLSHGFEITCTLSIFVPKPFTPFQWCGQTDLEVVEEHIKYLKEKTKHIKGVKINYQDKFVSQIEAVLTRGDKSLCDYIYSLYKKGCYLDAWGEYFDKNVWEETANELGFTLKSKASKEYDLTEALPWDFIDVGLDKEWLQKEYELAMLQGCEFNLQPTCEHKCVNCGVCKNLKTHKVLAQAYKASEKAQKINIKKEKFDPTRAHPDPNVPIYKYRLKITKKGLLKYFSHLDWQNTFHKSLARTGLRVAYSLGFNPTMKVSMGIALPLFAESEGEIVDIELFDNLTPEELMDIINPTLPEGARVISAKEIDRYCEPVEILAQWAEYKITPYIKASAESQSQSDFQPNPLYKFENFRYDVERVLSLSEILLTKKNKKGLEKTTDIKKSIGSYRFEEGSLFIYLKTGQGSDVPALRADSLMELIAPKEIFEVTRLRFLDEKLREL